MTHRQARVLVVDAVASARERLELLLRANGFGARSASGTADVMSNVAEETPDVVLVAFEQAPELVRTLKAHRIDVPVIVVAAEPELDVSIASEEAVDWLRRPVEADALVLAIERALRTRTLRLDVLALRAQNERLVGEAERAAHAREGLLSSVAHDIRAQLSSITLVTSSLARAALPEEHRRKVGIVQRAAKRVERLVDDLLDVGRLEAGTLELDPSVTEASAIVGDLSRLLQPIAAERDVTIATSVSDFALRCARDRIVRALEGLGSSVARAVAKGGVIRIRTEHRDGRGHLSIEYDTPGVGDDAVSGRVRGAEQESGSAAPAASALALVLAEAIARAHGGDLDVERRLGKTKLGLRLPLEGPRLAASARTGREVPAASS
jgi:signal transduction histidine kinase